MTDAEHIAMLEAECEDLRRRLARYEGVTECEVTGRVFPSHVVPVVKPHPTSPLITAMRYSEASSRRKRRGPAEHTSHVGSFQTFGPAKTPTPLDP